VGQVERGANRIYGVDQDRPTLQKYLRALLLTLGVGLPALISFLLLVAGGAIGASMQRGYHWSPAAVTTWNITRWPVSLGLTVVTVSLLFRYAPRRRQPGLSWLLVGAGVATALWWLVSLLLAAYVSESNDFGVTYGPLTGVMALLLWANLTGIALFVGVAFAAQLEATRVGISGPAVTDQDRALEERTETTLTSRPGPRPQTIPAWAAPSAMSSPHRQSAPVAGPRRCDGGAIDLPARGRVQCRMLWRGRHGWAGSSRFGVPIASHLSNAPLRANAANGVTGYDQATLLESGPCRPQHAVDA